MKSLNEIIAQFPEVGEVKEIIPLTAGLINQTYKVQTAVDVEAVYRVDA